MTEDKKIQIRCKNCGKLYIEVKIEGRIEYNFKCHRCKRQSTGVIVDKTNK